MLNKNLQITFALACAAAPLSAQNAFTKTKILDKLLAPNGIAVEADGNLLFTEVPDPGKFNGRNKVSRYVQSTKTVQLVVGGEPGPRNISATSTGAFYWTCDTAGVIFRFDKQGMQMLARGLSAPTGIAATASGNVYITELPEPGKPMGKNRVGLLTPTGVQTISMGEPEPRDIVVDGNENLYWTCKSAGVILRYDAKTKQKSLVLDGLEEPQGLAMDGMGRLYFTEIPTPGKSGAKGGRNKVWRYDPMQKALTLVSFGEPEPWDVAVTKDGKSVYWTCRTAGVVMRGDEQPGQAMISTMSSGKLGTTVSATLQAPMSEAGKPYLAATSFGVGPFMVDSRYVSLSPDALFFFTLTGSVFQGYMGMLDAKGMAKLSYPTPSAKLFEGLNLNTSFFVVDMKAPSSLSAISNTLRVRMN